MNENIIKITEAAVILEMSKQTTYNLIRSGDIPGFYQLGQGRQWRCKRKGFFKWHESLGLSGEEITKGVNNEK